MDLEKQLLEKAVNSILHGSTMLITKDNGHGELYQEEVRVGDLRHQLVEQIAQRLVSSEAFATLLTKNVTADLWKKVEDKILKEMTYSNLPWELKKRLEEEMRRANVSLRKVKVVTEVIPMEEKD